MARRCPISGTGVLSGHNVSHSNRKTKRRFLPNLQRVTLMSEALGAPVQLRLTPRALSAIDRQGGLDAFLLAKSSAKLGAEALRLKRRIQKAQKAKAGAPVAPAA